MTSRPREKSINVMVVLGSAYARTHRRTGTCVRSCVRARARTRVHIYIAEATRVHVHICTEVRIHVCESSTIKFDGAGLQD